MRFLAIILSVFILSLNMAPVMDMIGLNTDSENLISCCAPVSQEKPASDEDGNSPGKKLCNPFMSCTACVGFTLDDVATFSELIESFTETSAFYLQPASQQLTHSIWHPPKIA